MPQETPTVKAVNLEYCQEHYSELLGALLERQLGQFIADDNDQLVERLAEGKMDVGLEATNAIMAGAVQIFGVEAMEAANGCPVCAFHNIISHVADNLAAKYLRSN